MESPTQATLIFATRSAAPAKDGRRLAARATAMNERRENIPKTSVCRSKRGKGPPWTPPRIGMSERQDLFSLRRRGRRLRLDHFHRRQRVHHFLRDVQRFLQLLLD